MFDEYFEVVTFPTSEKFRILNVFSNIMWWGIYPKAVYIDGNGFKCDYFDFVFDDPVTARFICDILNQENYRGVKKNG